MQLGSQEESKYLKPAAQNGKLYSISCAVNGRGSSNPVAPLADQLTLLVITLNPYPQITRVRELTEANRIWVGLKGADTSAGTVTRVLEGYPRTKSRAEDPGPHPCIS